MHKLRMVTSLDVSAVAEQYAMPAALFLVGKSCPLYYVIMVKDIPFKAGTDIKHFSNVNIYRKHDCILVRFDQNGR